MTAILALILWVCVMTTGGSGYSTPEPIIERQPPVPPVAKVEPIVPASRHRVSGKASWYCSPQIPICHHAYPPGSMVAAACGKLRRAMGADWRGKTVTVRGPRNVISVKLVDWCGSKDKLIDLYREPMRRLGGSGVLRVTVSWD